MSTPDAAAIARELIAHRGDFVDIEAARIANALAIQRMLPQLLVESLGMAALGIGLYRTNYFTRWPAREIGRASCRERVCQYVKISVGAGALKKKKQQKLNTT